MYNIVNDKNVITFLSKKNEELFRYYRQAPKDIQKMLKNIYSACCRFNLNNTQTLFIMQKAISPFRQDILIKTFK